jgi:DUF1680 family protein
MTALTRITCLLATLLPAVASMSIAQDTVTNRKIEPALQAPRAAEMKFGGFIGDRIDANVREWLLTAPSTNPAMLQMFRDRDRTPQRDLVPWAGEFAGKYLISAVQSLRITRDATLRKTLAGFVKDLIATQAPSGYLGPFPTAEAMTGKGRWDLWGQYHVMYGLLLWYRDTGDMAALAAARRCADLFCRTFLDGHRRVVQAGSEEMNESASHVFTLLFEETGEARYLRMAQAIEKDWEVPPSGDYVRTALSGIPYYKTPKPRWEGLHSVEAVAELYFITGDEKYRRAFEQIWWSILEGDRHNTGGFSSGEQATGNPYDPRPIETCCTIAWMAITLDMLRMTGDSRAADELELSTWNAVAGAQCATGRWWTYNTPMDGERKAAAHDIVFQARAGSPELNCCSVNGPRGLGMLADWAVMTAPDGIALNWYGPSTFTARTASGQKVTLTQETDYPIGGKVRLTVSPDVPEQFVLKLRIPGWSRNTRVWIGDDEVRDVQPGTYVSLGREWTRGTRIDLVFDMSPRVWAGEKEAAGKASLYHGPLLLAYDPRFDKYDPRQTPAPDLSHAPERPVKSPPDPKPFLLLEFQTANGKTLTLCDFASAGAAGNPYVSWLPAPDLKPAAFSRDNPLRTRPANP